MSKWELWSSGSTRLRGANIYQRRVLPEIDGAAQGPGPFGPFYEQRDFKDLAALGANYVTISHPGLYRVYPPYEWDNEARVNLDYLLSLIEEHDLKAVIAFRTGPGRSEFSFHGSPEEDGWFDISYLNDSVWQSCRAQEAWCKMWRETAKTYRDHPAVVGYELMTEPNSNEVGSHVEYDRLEKWEPADFDAGQHNEKPLKGSLYDWRQLYPQIIKAVRGVDTETPILVGGMGWSAANWLNHLDIAEDDKTVYCVHQYEPKEFSHPEECATNSYPGELKNGCRLDRDWLESLLARTIDCFVEKHQVPVTVNEFGVTRTQKGGDEFIRDQIELFEARGLNWAIWQWQPSTHRYKHKHDHFFNARLGEDEQNMEEPIDVLDPDQQGDLLKAIVEGWSLNSP